MRASLLTLLGALSFNACSLAFELPTDVALSCSAADDCPSDYRCDLEAGYCVPQTPNDPDAPLLTDVVPPQTLARAGSVLEATFKTSEPVLGLPTVRLQLGAFSASVTVSALADGSYHAVYVVTGDEPEGLSTLSARLLDHSGNVTADALLGEVALDFTPPTLTSIAAQGGTSVDGAVWFDEATVSFEISAFDTASDVVAVRLDGAVDAAVELVFASPLNVTLSPGDGLKVVTFALVDGAGNVSAPVSREVAVDSAAPSGRVVLDLPSATGTFWTPQESVLMFFHSELTPPADFETYVVQLGEGAWTSAGREGRFNLTGLTPNTTTMVRIAERDVFGNLTPASEQAVLEVGQDATPPSKPEILFQSALTNLSTTPGVLLAGAVDPGGGPVTYQVLGGRYTQFTNVGSEPRLSLPAGLTRDQQLFVVQAVDRAGNASPADFVIFEDDPIARHNMNACIGMPCLQRTDYGARRGWGWLSERSNSSPDYYGLFVCHLASSSCGTLRNSYPAPAAWPFVSVDVWGRYFVVAERVSASATDVLLFDLGDDGRLGGDDDGEPVVLAEDAVTPFIGSTGVVFRKDSDDRIYFHAFGDDGRFDTGDDGEGEALVSFLAADTIVVSFNGRQLLTRDTVSSAHTLHDFGPDRLPDTSDDGDATSLDGTGFVLDETALATCTTPSLPCTGTVTRFGADMTFGTSDDTTHDVTNLYALAGDKVSLEDDGDYVLHDLSSGFSLGLGPTTRGNLIPDSLPYLSYGRLFFALNDASVDDRMAGTFELFATKQGYLFAGASDKRRPGGSVSNELAFLAAVDEDASEHIVHLQNGGRWHPSTSWTFYDQEDDLDVSGTRLVYRDSNDDVMLYDIGADGRPGTDDDRGPVAVTAGVTTRWPRIDGDVIVWCDLSNDEDGQWAGYGAENDLVSVVRALDLGADGWVGGGDDTTYDVTSHGKEVFPDVSGDRVVWLDLRDDTDGVCVGYGRDGVDASTCETKIYSAQLGMPEEALVTDTRPKGALSIDGDHVAFATYEDDDWNIFVHTLGEGTVQLTDTPDRYETYPTLDGDRLAYIGDGPVVVDAGTDGVFGTNDDERRQLSRDASGYASGDPLSAPRYHWLDGDWMLFENSALRLDEGPELFDAGAVALAIDDDPVTASELLVTAEPWVVVHTLALHVTIEHADTRELSVFLESPSGDEALVFDGALHPSATELDTRFDVDTSPGLFNHYGEPLDGAWTLRVYDRANGNAGTLVQWSLEHAR